MGLKLNIVKYRFLCLGISAILLLPGIFSMIYSMITYDTHTPVKVGIDYTGGTTLQYGIKENITNNELTAVRENLEKAGIEKPSLQIINANNSEQSEIKSILSIRTKFIDENSKDLASITNVVNQEFKSKYSW